MLIQNRKGKIAYVRLDKPNRTGAQVVRHKVMMLIPKKKDEKVAWQSEQSEEKLSKYNKLAS